MNKKFKFLTVLLALVMTLGAFAPFSARAEEGTPNATTTDETTKTVTLHKLIMTKDELTAWDSNKVERGTAKEGEKSNGYNGSQNLTQLNKILADMGKKEVKEIPNVYFALKFADGPNAGKYVKKDNTDNLKPAVPLTATENKDEAVGGLTTKAGVEFKTAGLKGKFEIDEVHEKSTYKGENGETLTDNKAVPVVITLPLVNNDGVVVNAHVYPKNTEDKPKIDKNFSEDEAKKYMSKDDITKLEAAIEHKAAFEKAKKLYKEDAKEYTDAESAYTKADQELIKKWGIDFEANTRGKQTLNKKIGDDVEYTVVTDIPAQTKWATAKWDDKMTEGLTYNEGSLTVKLEILKEDSTNKFNYTEVALTKGTDYKVTETKNGFVLNFEKSGLDKLNNKAQSQKVTLTYSAKINNTTVTDVEESNDVTFHYGNTPGKGNTPIPTKPSNKKIEVEKTWADGENNAVPKTLDGKPVRNFVVKIDLINANTGAVVKSDVELNTTNKYKATFNELDDETEYKVIEKSITYEVNIAKPGDPENWVAGTKRFDVEYGSGSGLITLKNHKSDNPTPLNPSEPKVITGGKKFVKTNQDGTERLAGAEFVVKNVENKYLALKSGTTTKAEVTAYEDAEKDYNGLITAWNKAVADNNALKDGDPNKKTNDTLSVTYTFAGKTTAETITGKTNVENRIKSLKDTRDKAFLAARDNYQWIEASNGDAAKKAGALVLTSDNQGRFEVTGLAYGTYTLEEVTPPEGYAKLTGNEEFLKFEIKKGSYTSEDVNIKYNLEDTANSAKQIINKKVSIPQTGGIGTVIFTVVGVMLMVGAAFALKRRKEDELEGLA